MDMLIRLSLPGAVVLAMLLIAGSALPASAQSGGAPAPDSVVAAFEAALDAHDATRASQQLADSATLLGMDSATGRQQVEQWIKDQIDHGVMIEIGPLHVNGSRVTWTARVSRSDWRQAGVSFRYVDEEAAVSGKQITVIGAHVRPQNQPPPDGTNFVRARNIAPTTEMAALTRPSGWFVLVALIASGLFTGLYVATGRSKRDAGPASLQKGRLVPELARAVELRRSRDLT